MIPSRSPTADQLLPRARSYTTAAASTVRAASTQPTSVRGPVTGA
jgi:hypothetical protein